MKILVCEPGREPYPTEIPCEASDIMQTVGGVFEIANLDPENRAVIFCNEQYRTLPANRVIGTQIFGGVFFIAGTAKNEYGEDTYCSLTDEQTAQYTEMFRLLDTKPEQNNDISDALNADDGVMLPQ